MFQRNDREVDCLHRWPDHQVGLVAGQKTGAQPLHGVIAFHDSHGRQERGEVRRGEEALVGGHTCEQCSTGRLQDNIPLEEAKPGCSSGAEDGWKRGMLETVTKVRKL